MSKMERQKEIEKGVQAMMALYSFLCPTWALSDKFFAKIYQKELLILIMVGIIK